MAKQTHTYIDFTKIGETPCFANDTNAIATAADNQVDYTYVNGHLIDWIQTGANALIFPDARESAPLGWAWPLDGGSTDSCEISEGGLMLPTLAPKSFTVGTHAFFIEATMSVLGNIDNVTLATVGFRLQAAQADITSQATLGSAYNDAVHFGVTTTAGAVTSSVTIGGAAAVLTAATASAWTVVGTAVTGKRFRVDVSSGGVCTFSVDGTADTLCNAVAVASRTLANGIVVIPSVNVCVANGTGAQANPVIIQRYQCGLA